MLAHELWHVRRYDWGWVLVEEVVRAACWFHPAMWALISEIQAAREETVDELAILATGSRRSYMDALITFAERPSTFAAAAFARRRHLVQRILMISKEHVMSSTRVVACSAVLIAVVAGASWFSAETFPLTAQAQAPQDRSAPPPPPPAPSDFPQQETAMLEKVKEQPSAVNYHALAVLYFERTFRGTSLQVDDRSKLVNAGLAASDAALSYDPDYMEALVYKNLLLRLKGQLETDPAERVRLIEEADRLRSRAMTLRQQHQAPPRRPGMMPPPPPPPPPPPDETPVDAPKVDGELPIRVGGNIAPPTKTRDVNAVYPPEALANKVEGAVVIEATIDREGIVRDTRVLKSVPMLDKAAIEAVSQWEFTPTLLNGAPKPVIAVFTINFTLQ